MSTGVRSGVVPLRGEAETRAEPFEWISETAHTMKDGSRIRITTWQRRDPSACFGTWHYRGPDAPVLVLPEALPPGVAKVLVQTLASAIVDQILAEIAMPPEADFIVDKPQ